MSRSPTPDPEPASLEQAIEDSHPERLAETLLAVCEKSAEAKAIVSELLLSEIKPESVKNASKKGELTGKKRKRWEACEACDEEFDVENNEDGGCSWHDGELEKDLESPVFKNGDVEIDGDVDEEELAQEFPEAVRFTCCKGNGTADGCKKGKHRAVSAEKIAKLQELLNGDTDEED